MKVRKKPVVVEAVQFTRFVQYDSTTRSLPNDLLGLLGPLKYYLEYDSICIPTLEGLMTASLNDWIIRGVNGEIYPCKPDIFEKTYEIIDE